MDKKWHDWYIKISRELGISYEKDMKSAETLEKVLKYDISCDLYKVFEGRDAYIFGAAPSLERDVVSFLKSGSKGVIVSADGATTCLLKYNLIPDVVVTDLDGRVEDIIKASKRGAHIVVHAHGDNLEKIEKFVPEMKRVVGTTQTENIGKVRNYFGFTDGDRAVFIAFHFGARRVFLLGMDFGNFVGKYSKPGLKMKKKASERKKIKLRIAKELIEEISREKEVINISGIR